MCRIVATSWSTSGIPRILSNCSLAHTWRSSAASFGTEAEGLGLVDNIINVNTAPKLVNCTATIKTEPYETLQTQRTRISTKDCLIHSLWSVRDSDLLWNVPIRTYIHWESISKKGGVTKQTSHFTTILLIFHAVTGRYSCIAILYQCRNLPSIGDVSKDSGGKRVVHNGCRKGCNVLCFYDRKQSQTGSQCSENCTIRMKMTGRSSENSKLFW